MLQPPKVLLAFAVSLSLNIYFLRDTTQKSTQTEFQFGASHISSTAFIHSEKQL